MDKKYISQIGEEKKIVLDKNFIFKNKLSKYEQKPQADSKS